MHISDWSSDVCSSYLGCRRLTNGDDFRMGGGVLIAAIAIFPFTDNDAVLGYDCTDRHLSSRRCGPGKVKRTAHGQRQRSEEHTSELQPLMRISYAVFCLTKKTDYHTNRDYIIP